MKHTPSVHFCWKNMKIIVSCFSGLLCFFVLMATSDAQAQVDPKICLQGSALAARAYSTLQQLDKEFPETKSQNLLDVRRSIFEHFRKQVASNSETLSFLFEAERAWKELGVKDYLENPNLTLQSYERIRYELCISKRTN